MALKNIANLVDAKKRAKENLAEKFKLDFEQSYINFINDNQKQPSNYLKPSSIWGCKRMIYFMTHNTEVGEKTLSDLTMVGIQESGTDRHKRIQTVIKSMPNVEWVDLEEHCKGLQQIGINTQFIGWDAEKIEGKCLQIDYNLSFLCDGLIRYDNKDIIIEIKTESTTTFKNRIAPKQEHIQQATCYSLALNVPYILFIYEDRNFLTKKYFLVEITEDMKKATRQRLLELNAIRNGHELPPMEEDKCKYCNYKKACKNK